MRHSLKKTEAHMATNRTTPQEFPTDNIYQSAFLELNDNPAKLTLQGGRVTFLHKADPSLFSLLSRFSDSSEMVSLTSISFCK
jgi:hypothetical protein